MDKFLITRAILTDDPSGAGPAALLNSLLDRGDFACLEAYVEKFRRDQENKYPTDEPGQFLFRFRRAMVQSEAALRSQNLKGSRFQEANDYLDKFYFQQKMKLYAAMHALEPMAPPEEYPFHEEEEVLHYLDRRNHLNSPLIELYATAVRLEKNDIKIEAFPEILAKLLDYSDQFSPYDLRQLTGFFLNFLDRYKFEGGDEIRGQIFALLKMLLDREAIYIQGKIATPWFNKIVFSALHLNELDWLEGFLFDHEDKIVGEHAKEIWELSMLRYTFEMGAYKKVLSQLRIYHFTHPRFDIWARIIKLKAVFEVALASYGQEDAFERSEEVFKAILAAKAFVRTRKRLHEVHRDSSLSLLSKIHRLANFWFLEKGDSNLLREEVESMGQSPFEKRWLQRKLEALK